jgi:hypothetical protein
MVRGPGAVLAVLLLTGWGLCGPAATAQQVREREVEITGPRGKSVQRKFRVERTPGSIQRELSVRGPAGHLQRSATIPVPRPSAPRPGVYRPLPRPGPPRGPLILERNVIIERDRGGDAWGPVVGFAAPFFGAMIGSGVAQSLSSPPPPPPPAAPSVVVVPGAAAPVVVQPAPAPVVIQPSAPAPASEVYLPDPIHEELARLQSWHGETRLEAVQVLGRLRDARAVTPLIRALRDDRKDEVREHAAWALGQIGDPTARPYLEVAATSDSRRKVREAASRALVRLSAMIEAPMPDAPPFAPTTAPATATPPPPPPMPISPRGPRPPQILPEERGEPSALPDLKIPPPA